MTGVPDPLRVIYGDPLPHWGPIAGQTRQGTSMGSGDRQLCEAPAAQGVRAGLELVWPGPGQSDFGRIDISTVKGALRSIHWNVDHCPVAMQLKKLPCRWPGHPCP
jgi:hypothetical protein